LFLLCFFPSIFFWFWLFHGFGFLPFFLVFTGFFSVDFFFCSVFVLVSFFVGLFFSYFSVLHFFLFFSLEKGKEEKEKEEIDLPIEPGKKSLELESALTLSHSSMQQPE
jgi:hypothetical protein